MRRRSRPGDPTLLLVLGLVLVVAAILVVRGQGGGPDDAATAIVGSQDGDAAATSPGPTPAPTDQPTDKKRKKRNDGNPPRLDIKQQGKKQCVAAGADTDITVVSYNIKSGHLAGSLSQIAQTLRDSGADVVFMQEVDQRRFASGRVDQPAFFADALDWSYAYGKNAPYAGGGGIGNLIVSRFPLTEVSNTLLPRPPGTVQRGLQHAVIDIDGTEVSLYNTHLQNANEPARILQVAAINQLIADDLRPRVLGGDMNAPPGSAPMNALTTQWTDTWLAAGSGGGRTAPAGAPRARIDYLLHAGEGLTPLAADVLPIRLSDHRAVRAAYALTDPRDPICFQKLG